MLLTNTTNYSNQVKKLSSKVTVLVCVTTRVMALCQSQAMIYIQTHPVLHRLSARFI